MNERSGDPTGLLDDDGLRATLAAVSQHGWDGEDGRVVLEALQQRAPRWARALDGRLGNASETTEAADVMRIAWLTLHTFGPHVAAADSPWTYLWTTVRRAVAVDNAEHACLASGVLQLHRQRGETPPTAVRLGVDATTWAEPDDGRHAAAPRPGWSPALNAVVQVIVDAGGDPALWADAVDRAVDVMADARQSYQEWALRRDPYLTETLGLLPHELSALAALLIGRRRGDRAAESLLLALRRDVTTSVADVPRARERLAVLVARPQLRRPASPQVA